MSQIVQQDAFNTAEELSICLVSQVRTALNLTQQQIADLIDLHVQNISKAENDRYDLKRKQRDRLLKLLEISHMPGIAELMPFLVDKSGGDAAFHVAQTLHWTAAV